MVLSDSSVVWNLGIAVRSESQLDVTVCHTRQGCKTHNRTCPLVEWSKLVVNGDVDGSLILFGCYPRFLVDSIKPVATVIARMATAKQPAVSSPTEKAEIKARVQPALAVAPRGSFQKAEASFNTEP